MIALAALLLLVPEQGPCAADTDCGPALVCHLYADGRRRCVPGCPAPGCPPGSACRPVPPGWPHDAPRMLCRKPDGRVLP